MNKRYRYIPIVLPVMAACLVFVSRFAVAQSDSFDYLIKDALDSAENGGGPSQDTAGIVPEKLIDELRPTSMDIHDVLEIIALKSGTRFAIDDDVTGKVTIYLKNIAVEDALRIILNSVDLAFKEENGVVRVMTADNFKARYGYRFNQLIHTKVVPLLYGDPEEIIAKLNKIKSTVGKIIYNEETNTVVLMDSPSKIQEMADLIKEVDLPIETKEFPLKHVQAADIADDVREVLTRDTGTISVDTNDNKIIVVDTLAKLKEVEKFIERLDQKEKNVEIKTKIINITLNDEYIDGVDWEAIVSNYQSLDLIGHPQNGAQAADNTLKVGTLSPEDLDVLLEALDTVGSINTISDANTKAELERKIQLPVKSTEIISSTGINEEAAALEWDEELRFNVVVGALDKEMLQVKIKPQIVSLYEENPESARQNAPEAVVKVENGSTIVIGGMFKEVMVESIRKIPLLGDLPIVGFAFRNERERILKTEIIVFITTSLQKKEQ